METVDSDDSEQQMLRIETVRVRLNESWNVHTTYGNRRIQTSREVHRLATTAFTYLGQSDNRVIAIFRREKYENLIEILRSWEREMKAVGNKLTDLEKVEWVAKRLQDSARKMV